MTDSSLNLAECTAIFKPGKNYDYPNRLRYLNGVAQHPKLGELARMGCLIVERRDLFKTHGDFLRMMDGESDEILQFAKGLFDAHSNVRPWLIDGGYRSGSGCWGAELSTGDILYIQDLTVKEQVRGHGVGSWVLQQLLQSPFVHALRGKAHIFCWPMPPWNMFDATSRSAEKVARVNRFFRNNGFRRIGRTSFFGYSLDPNHPSRHLSIEDDPGLLGDNFPNMSDDIDPESEYPLHFAIANIKTPEISAILTGAHALDPAIIHQPDFMGFTPLFVAAGSQNLPALRTLLDLGVTGDLRNTSNKCHMTPLEKFQDTMRDTREFVETMRLSDGYSTEELACEYLLKEAMGMPLIAQSEGEYIVKRRFGCTCGSCTDQWLSPRMRFRLQVQSEVCYSSMARDLDCFKPNMSLSAHEIPSLNYLPLTLRNQLHKPFYQGYRSIFSAIAHILRDAANGVPTPARVLSQALRSEPSVNFYISEGGRVEYALDAIIDSATEHSALSDGIFEALWDNQDVSDGGFVDMPKCANDLAFMLVRKKLGVDPRIAKGPYYHEDVEMLEEDSDEEENEEEEENDDDEY